MRTEGKDIIRYKLEKLLLKRHIWEDSDVEMNEAKIRGQETSKELLQWSG